MSTHATRSVLCAAVIAAGTVAMFASTPAIAVVVVQPSVPTIGQFAEMNAATGIDSARSTRHAIPLPGVHDVNRTTFRVELVDATAPNQVAAAPSTPPPWQPIPKTWWCVTIDSIRFDLRGVLLFLLLLIGGWVMIVYKGRHPNPVPLGPSARIPIPVPGSAREVNRIHGGFPAPAPGRPAAVLYKEEGGQRTQRFPIEKSSVRIGSDARNDLVVQGDAYVSRKHAKIQFQEGALYLTDLGSSNGTFRNGSRLGHGAVMLTHGDLVRFGRTTYVIRRSSRSADAPHRH
jgi:hypothetical protein